MKYTIDKLPNKIWRIKVITTNQNSIHVSINNKKQMNHYHFFLRKSLESRDKGDSCTNESNKSNKIFVKNL